MAECLFDSNHKHSFKSPSYFRISMPSQNLTKNIHTRMHPYAHAHRRQREYLNEVTLARTLPSPSLEMDHNRNTIAKVLNIFLDWLIIILFATSMVLRIVNYYLIKEVISILNV
ncbi:hypothetical protein J3R30DRAFT_3696203 [Lentinula aciculospora]|uniref:Uncharacterized protein n=1 Tax=Lentinula aciculospora TaxID=153920 RepID=A0A9W9AQL3_9AGAR|nr:hypothetical protein J3R30DRAFT_3696203 [Lentinula aciculospora]